MTKSAYHDPYQTINRHRAQDASGHLGCEASMHAHLAQAPRWDLGRRVVVAMPPREPAPLTPKPAPGYDPHPPEKPFPQRFDPCRPKKKPPKKPLTPRERATRTVRARAKRPTVAPIERRELTLIERAAQTVAKRLLR